jgi:hypothetical protein
MTLTRVRVEVRAGFDDARNKCKPSKQKIASIKKKKKCGNHGF